MSNAAPTLINLPPPPSDPVTPSDMPGTPNSTTTSMSELSTVAIKDGHRGHFAHHHHPQDAERADRISRLAGLERVTAGRQPGLNVGGIQSTSNQPPGYFDQNNQPQIFRERSTVGSASATGSVGGRTTWASGSDVYDQDKMSMSEDQDNETGSVGGMSDEASLVGFGEGARTPARQQSNFGSPVIGKASIPAHLRDQAPPSPMTGVSISSAGTSHTTTSTEQQKQDARMIDGMTYDNDFVDTTGRTPPQTGYYPENTASGRSPTGAETAQRLFSEHIGNTGGRSQEALSVDEKGLGKFPFEGKK
ncbi:uncharacterized protein BDZ99DRAFT_435830 [Mytilinidion resinicola]|uniref:Uncharacterized protein n=1 Tax=Mytilinidion resinicola TaxID=574789 RepID=A0A6A6Z3A0_9PEZI|nr:uncharacterized protein BDZ99DRAFT_435830 [Mytilinidion resinicola]KAF2815480.1 hypothetical protein BDZ99DRAFT_435830 [Mytilinidion resinicola]